MREKGKPKSKRPEPPKPQPRNEMDILNRVARDAKVELELHVGKSLPDLELTVTSIPFEPGEKEYLESILVVNHQVYICHCCDEAKMSKDVIGRYVSFYVEDVGPDFKRLHHFQNCDSCLEKYTKEERKERSIKHRHYEYGILPYTDTDLNGMVIREGRGRWE
ncbi:hypothetical protein [Bacillus phage YungSlug]|nr:hypothetical protein [Bacillus phage YungSlug]